MSPGGGENVSNVRAPAEPGGRAEVAYDWYPGGIPGNVVLGRDVYVDTSYGFVAFHSERRPGLVLGDATGAYDRANLVVGPAGQVTVGAYTVLNGVYVVCEDRVTIGAHCLLAWGAVITDAWLPPGAAAGPAGLAERRRRLAAAAADPRRLLAPWAARPVTLEDNVWVGFDAVVLPGVTLGRGCVVGSKCVVTEDVPPYAVVVGSPPRVVRVLAPDDTDAARRRALAESGRA